MHLKFPEKVDNGLRFLKLKLLPKTLFFRTMLLIFIPLIVVQVVSSERSVQLISREEM